MNATSRYDYHLSRDLEDQPFHALLMAAMRKADTSNGRALAGAFPDVAAELQERYDTPGGYLSTEEGYAGIMRERAIAAGELPPDKPAPREHDFGQDGEHAYCRACGADQAGSFAVLLYLASVTARLVDPLERICNQLDYLDNLVASAREISNTLEGRL